MNVRCHWIWQNKLSNVHVNHSQIVRYVINCIELDWIKLFNVIKAECSLPYWLKPTKDQESPCHKFTSYLFRSTLVLSSRNLFLKSWYTGLLYSYLQVYILAYCTRTSKCRIEKWLEKRKEKLGKYVRSWSALYRECQVWIVTKFFRRDRHIH